MAKNEQRIQKNAWGVSLKRQTDLTNCSLQESHIVDYSLGIVEDLKTKQDIHTSLSSFHFRDYWGLKDLQRSATHQIHGSYPRFYQTSSRDRELATSPGGPFYFQSLWLYKNSLYELNSVSWELPECPILYILQCQITLPVIALKLLSCSHQGFLVLGELLPG